ncbi:TolB family protein [Oceanithermus sp.]
MKRAAVVLAVLAWAAQAWAWGQVESERVRVLYPRQELAAYAEEVLLEAEAALDVLEPLFGPREGRVVLRVNDSVDWFNAYATPVPRRTVELLAPVPAGPLIDLRSPSVTYLLLVHELTHTRQLTYREQPGGKQPLRLGLVTELSAPMPPAWFVEGVATYMESRYTPGGRLDWAYTQGLINALLEEDTFPDLAEMGLYTYRDWPSGQTRYLLGVRFVQYLIERHGWDTVLATLQHYNTGLLVPPSFAAAWERASGTSLADEWTGWVARERERSKAYAAAALPAGELMAAGIRPAVSPDGRRVAYWNGGYVWVANADGSGARRLARVRPQRLWWRDDGSLVYSRYVREGDGVASDLFALDVASGREQRLTRGLHVRLGAPSPDGCLYFVRERAGEPATLGRWCEGRVEEVWRAPGGEHLVGLALSPNGRVALAVAHGGVVDVALLEGGRLRYLAAGPLDVELPAPPPDPCAGGGAELGDCFARDRYQHLQPSWDGDASLLFIADEGGVFDLYRIELPEEKITRLSASLGGVVDAAAREGNYLVAEVGGKGHVLRWLAPLEAPVALRTTRPADHTFCGGDASRPQVADAPVQTTGARQGCGDLALGGWQVPERPSRRTTYRPWPSLKPYGWLLYPTVAGDAPAWEASVYGLDDSRLYSYRLSAGYAPVSGSAYGYLALGVGAGVDLAGPTRPLGFTLRAGAWPAGGGVAFGVLPGLASAGDWDRWSWRAGVEAGPVWSTTAGWQAEYHSFARAGWEDRDPWGYLTGGGYGGVYAGTGYAWGLAGAAWRPGLQSSFALEARLLGGYGIPVLLGAAPVGDGLGGEARLRYAFKPEWRSLDGWMALERLTLAPAAHVRYDPAADRWSYGADLGLYADVVFLYVVPLPLGLRAGWDGGWWWRVELGAW